MTSLPGADRPSERPTAQLRNWAGNQSFHARRLLAPRSMDELQESVRRSDRLRPLGTGHAFTALADTDGDLVSLASLPRRFDLDPSAGTVTVDGGSTYGDLCGRLDAAGFALHNLASLPHLSIAGAIATSTHGSGTRHGSLATSVVGLEMVRADGELEQVGSGPDVDPAHAGALAGGVVSLGALGVVTTIRLAVEPTYRMRQDVVEGLPFTTAIERFDDVVEAAPIVSLFTDWREARFHQVWLKRRIGSAGVDEVAALPEVLRGTSPAPADRHPIPGLSAAACTPQLGLPGPWHERLPHFRLDHVPSAGAELQSEFLLDRSHGGGALAALTSIAPRLAPLVWVTEIRTIAADGYWLSPASGRDSVAVHFTWKPDWPAVRAVLPIVERLLRPFDPRPHWGKLFTLPPDEVRERYPERSRFAALAARLDPDGKLRNDFLETYVLDAR